MRSGQPGGKVRLYVRGAEPSVPQRAPRARAGGRRPGSSHPTTDGGRGAARPGPPYSPYARYPNELAGLEAEWWRKNARVEVLCALAAWRDEIDNGGGMDFREELSFHAQLTDIQHLLEQTPGVGADVFRPSAPPPAEWRPDLLNLSF